MVKGDNEQAQGVGRGTGRGIVPGAADGTNTMAILPISALTSPSLLTLSEGFGEEGDDASTGHMPQWNRFGEDEDDEFEALDPDQIVELMSSSLNLD